jgi:hypothetical protein
MYTKTYAKPHIAPTTARTASTNGKRRMIIIPGSPPPTKMSRQYNMNDVANAAMQNESRGLVFFIEVMNAFMESGIMTIYSQVRVQKSVISSGRVYANIGIE